MTSQESAMLQDLLGKIEQTTLAEKDPDAEAAIEQAIGSNPDALYILTQTVLVQNIALGQAKSQVDQLRQQVADLQQRAAHPARATSFLGALLGHEDPPPPPVRPQVMPPQQQGPYTPPPYQPVQSYPPQGFPQQGYGPYGGGGGGFFGGSAGVGGPPSFLRSAATTAAGVAAGALAFEGVESLLHGFGHGGYGGFGGSGFGGGPVEENITNNYYDGSRTDGSGADGTHEHHEHESLYDERPGADLGSGTHDVSAQGDDTKLDNASYDPGSSGDSGTQGDLVDRDFPDDLSSSPDDNTAFDDSNDNFGGGDGDSGDDSGSFGGDDLS